MISKQAQELALKKFIARFNQDAIYPVLVWLGTHPKKMFFFVRHE